MGEWIYVNKPDAACNTCNGACCRGIRSMPMNCEERDFMLAGGNRLKTLIPAMRGRRWSDPQHEAELLEQSAPGFSKDLVKFMARTLEVDQGLYTTEDGPCGYLNENNQCAAHDDPNRPAGCRDVKEGDEVCLEYRKANLGMPAMGRPDSLPPAAIEFPRAS